MPKKFDTNPLDPKFPERAEAAVPTTPVADYTAPQRTRFSTSEFPVAPGSVTEEETRRLEQAEFNTYAYNAAQPPAPYQPRPLVDTAATTNLTIGKSSVPEKWLIGLPYIPFKIGLVAGLILLLVLPKEEAKVRFHAAQGLAAHVGILIVTSILGIAANATDLASFASTIFLIVTTIMLIIFAIRAWQGKGILIESVEDLTNWLEEKIGPIKS